MGFGRTRFEGTDGLNEPCFPVNPFSIFPFIARARLGSVVFVIGTLYEDDLPD